ncbi:MAG: FHA domain-containing protein [Pirellulales bacterium]
MLAYLVIREGSNWTDVFRLVADQTVTIGRAPTNMVILKDDRCSRYHGELFHSQGQWTVRDLDSRNGTLINGEPVQGDRILSPGDVIRIGHTQLAFVHDISKAFADLSGVRPATLIAKAELGAMDDSVDSVLNDHEPTTITHRRGQTKLLDPGSEVDHGAVALPKLGRAAAQLAKLAFELAKAPNVKTLTKLALDGLFSGTQVDSGAVLLVPRDFQGDAGGQDLEIAASRSDSGHAYQRLSGFLATTVMREGEAVLARNVMGDSHLGLRDSQGEFMAISVICADPAWRSRAGADSLGRHATEARARSG